MLRSFVAEILKLYKRPATWVLIIVALVLSQVFNYLVPYAGFLGAENDRAADAILSMTLPDSLVANSISGFPLFAGALALTLGAISVGGEYGWGTLKTAFTQKPRRLSIYAGQITSLALAVFVIVAVVFVFGAITSYFIARSQGEVIDWPGVMGLAEGVASGWLILYVWCMFGAMLAFLFRGMALPIGLGVVWILGVENLIVNVAARLLEFVADSQKFLPGVNAGSLVSSLGGSDTPGVNDIVTGTQATLVLLAYAVAFILIAAVVVQWRDVT